MKKLKKLLGRGGSADSGIDISPLVRAMRYELIPLKSVDEEMHNLPPNSPVSVTCSPVKGLQATLDLTAQILDLGHDAVPHFSARLTEDSEHVARLAAWCRDHGVREVFLVAGDAETPVGKYEGVVDFLRDLLDTDHGLQRIGITSYPDGHALIAADVIHDALHAKQALLQEAGIAGHASTQMCFDAQQIVDWLEFERSEGFVLPVHLGVPGVIDRVKLLTMGTRLGIGASMRFLSKNASSIKQMLIPGGYDPDELLGQLVGDMERLGIEGLHCFTFNNVKATAHWQEQVLAAR